MSIKKIIFGLISLVVIGVAGMAFYGLQNLDDIIKRAIVHVGSQTTQTSVTLDKVKLSLMDGRGELHKLQIDNPQGFSSPYAMLIGQAALQIDPQSLRTDVIVIKEVAIDGVKIIAQQKNLKDLNLLVLSDNLSKSSSSKPQSEQPDSPKSDIRLRIEKITFSNNSIRLISEQLGETTLTMPTIALKDLGDKEKGSTPKELTLAIFKPLLAQATKQVKSQLKSQAKDSLKEKAKDKLKSLFGN